jgi:hypothetical protein
VITLSTELSESKPMGFWKVKVLGALVAGSSLVALVSADLNASIAPILSDVALLFPDIVTLVTAAIPIIILLAIVGFLVGLFDSILGKIRL